ncbi:MAG: AMP-binding protein [Flavobacteriales bacterium]|nr:MAG: AMP-binding protein [Flavobacteriales bacterium]
MGTAMNFYDVVRERAQRWPASVAVDCGSERLTFVALIGQAEARAAELQRLGLRTGMGLGIVDHNGPGFIVSMLAGLKCGAVVMPIADNLTKAERAAAVEGAGLHAVLEQSTAAELSIGGGPFALCLHKRDHASIAPHVPDAAFIRFTSGTTGTSKGVVIGHRSVVARVEAANKGLQLGEGDAVVWVLPMAYHFVVSVMLYLYFGVTIVLADDLTAASIIEAADRSGARMLYASPMHVRMLVSDEGCTTLGPLERVISTSAGLPVDLCHRFHLKFGRPVYQAFGIIEVGLPIINADGAAQHPEAVGHVLPDFQAAILDESLNPLPDGNMGQLALKGPGLFDGYLSPPSLRADNLHNGWFLTGDLAIRSPDGLITIAGRSKSVINVAGNKVFPEEVEAVLLLHSAVRGCRVHGGKHPLLGEVVEADVVLNDGAVGDAEDLIAHCRTSMAAFKLPQRIRFVDELEMTTTGKVKR